jgi:hypothetical protein
VERTPRISARSSSGGRHARDGAAPRTPLDESSIDDHLRLFVRESARPPRLDLLARRIERPLDSVDAEIKEQSREVWVMRWIDDLMRDLGSGVRILTRNRGYALVAVLTLALGIGSNTAVFTIVNDVLLKPLPYNDPDRLVVVWERNSDAGRDRDPVAPRNFQDWVAAADRFEGLAAYRIEGFALTGSGEAEQLTNLVSTPNLFRVLDVEPLPGRPGPARHAYRPDGGAEKRVEALPIDARPTPA